MDGFFTEVFLSKLSESLSKILHSISTRPSVSILSLMLHQQGKNKMLLSVRIHSPLLSLRAYLSLFIYRRLSEDLAARCCKSYLVFSYSLLLFRWNFPHCLSFCFLCAGSRCNLDHNFLVVCFSVQLFSVQAMDLKCFL